MPTYVNRDDIYNLFGRNGTAHLHVADIDQLPVANVVPAPSFRVPSREEWLQRYCTGKQLAGYHKRDGGS